MGCTTLLVGKKASFNGSTIIARNDDSPSGIFHVKKLKIIDENKNGEIYKSKISKIEIKLPKESLKYSLTPNVSLDEGIWGASGINSKNVGMSATETITSNPIVLGADPLVKNGIGEEDFVSLILPYINSAKEGVIRLGKLLKEYGTYESNGIAFNDGNEIWWVETIGGHHFIAKRVKDEEYVIMPNQFGLDNFDFKDAYSSQKENICSEDLKEFVSKFNLDLSFKDSFNPRIAFGSHSDSDHVYNTPRSYYMLKYFNPNTLDSKFNYTSDDLPWSKIPEKKITIQDIKYILGSYYQNTEYNPYLKKSNSIYRPIGVNRTAVLSIIEINNTSTWYPSIEWISFGSNAFNASIPFIMEKDTSKVPQYLSNTTLNYNSNNFYWNSRLIGVLADSHYNKNLIFIERYQNSVFNKSYEILFKYLDKYKNDSNLSKENNNHLIDEINKELIDMLKKETQKVLDNLIYSSSLEMKNSFSRSDN